MKLHFVQRSMESHHFESRSAPPAHPSAPLAAPSFWKVWLRPWVCRSRYCCFDGDFCKTAQAPLAAAKGRPSGKQRLANKSIIPPLYPQRQTADSSLEMPFGDKTKAAWPLRAETLKLQAMIKRRSGKRQASLKLALISIASSTWAHQGAIGHGKYASIRCTLGQ